MWNVHRQMHGAARGGTAPPRFAAAIGREKERARRPSSVTDSRAAAASLSRQCVTWRHLPDLQPLAEERQRAAASEARRRAGCSDARSEQLKP